MRTRDWGTSLIIMSAEFDIEEKLGCLSMLNKIKLLSGMVRIPEIMARGHLYLCD
jgi:hypothetical protein